MTVHSPLATAPRPFLKWAGGKSQVLLQYAPYFPKTFKTYYEPFLGGGAIFFHLTPQRVWLADINPELVNAYRCIRDQVEAVIQGLSEHHVRHSVDHYYETRAHPGVGDVERAARLLYLNKTCFNGLYRENSKGRFNVPMGRYKNPTICNPDALRAASHSLKQARIEETPFESVLDFATSEDDFVYFDPPYHPISSTSSFTAYNRYSFHGDDQIRLQAVFAKLAQRGVKVMLSNSDCPFIRELYQDFTIQTIQATRSINSNASRRGKITEVLVTSYLN